MPCKLQACMLTAADKAEGQAVKGLISGSEVVANGIDDQAQKFVFL